MSLRLSLDDPGPGSSRSEAEARLSCGQCKADDAAFWWGRFDKLAPVVERGIARGDLRAGIDAGLVLEMLLMPLQGRILLFGDPIPDDMPERLVVTATAKPAPAFHKLHVRPRTRCHYQNGGPRVLSGDGFSAAITGRSPRSVAVAMS